MRKKETAKRKLANQRPAAKINSDRIDAGTLEGGIFEPDDDIHREFEEAQRVSSGGQELLRRKIREHNADEPLVAGEDLDADWTEASTSGEESVVGGNPVPDQNNIEIIGEAVGLEYEDNEPLHTTEKISERDRHRWELDPASSEDYKLRIKEQAK